jgi:hypothetical protein
MKSLNSRDQTQSWSIGNNIITKESTVSTKHEGRQGPGKKCRKSSQHIFRSTDSPTQRMNIWTFVSLLCLRSATANNPSAIITTQDANNLGTIQLLEPSTGQILIKSPLQFQFDWPYVQMTVDLPHQILYIVTYPKSSTGPVLYELDAKLSVIAEYNSSTYSFFDLQYAPNYGTLYGIKVTGTYQRTLCNFVLYHNEIYETELHDLPTNWYVNASSYDTTADYYFALINHFSGMPDSTDLQQLIFTDFSACSPGMKCNTPTKITYVTEFDGQLQFIAYSVEITKLFVLGINLQTNIASFSYIDVLTGVCHSALFSVPQVTEVGPLVAHSGIQSNSNGPYVQLSFWTKGSNTWTEWSVEYYLDTDTVTAFPGKVTYSTPDYKYISAGVNGYS